MSQSFERLNKLGVLGPEKNTPPAGSDRHREEGRDHSAWQGSVRQLRLDRFHAYVIGRGVVLPD